jgi:hypothetical protein
MSSAGLKSVTQTDSQSIPDAGSTRPIFDGNRPANVMTDPFLGCVGGFSISDSLRQRVPIPATANRSADFCPSSGKATNVGTRLVFQISLHLFTGKRCEFGLVTSRKSCTVRSYFTSGRTRAGTLFAPRRNCQDASDPPEIGHHHRNQQDTVRTAGRAVAIDIPSVRDRFRIKK